MYQRLITANEEEIYCQSPPPNSQHRPLCWFLKCFLSYFSSSKRDSAFTPSLRFTLFSKAVWLFQPQGVLSFLKSRTQHRLTLQLAWVSNRFVGDLPVRATVIMCASRSTLEKQICLYSRKSTLSLGIGICLPQSVFLGGLLQFSEPQSSQPWNGDINIYFRISLQLKWWKALSTVTSTW